MHKSFYILLVLAMVCVSFQLAPSTMHMNEQGANHLRQGDSPAAQIGNTGENSSYLLSSNLTVKAGTNLSFVNTSIMVDGNLSIRIYGSLNLINSSITSLKSGEYEGYRLAVMGIGGRSLPAHFSMDESSIRINLTFSMKRTDVSIMNSTITSAGNGTWVSYSFTNSLVHIWNSTLNGLHHFVQNYRDTVAYSYGSGYPIARNGFISMGFAVTGSAPISGMTVDIQYSGNNPGHSDFIVINVNGIQSDSVRIFPNSTGSLNISRYQNLTYEFPESISVSSLEDNLSRMVFYNYSYSSGSNLTIWNLSLSFYTADQLFVLGNDSYDYMVSNSTVYAANTRFDFTGNYSGYNFGRKCHSIILEKASKAFLETVPEASASFPFSVSRNSSLYLYGEAVINPVSHGKTIHGAPYEILPLDGNNSNFEFPIHLHLKAYRMILLSTQFRGNKAEYVGNYVLKILGEEADFYMPSAQEITSYPRVMKNITIDMPSMTFDLVRSVQYSDLSVMVSYRITGISDLESAIDASIMITGYGEIMRSLQAVSLHGNNLTLNFTLFPDQLLSGTYEFILNISYTFPYEVNDFAENVTLHNFTERFHGSNDIAFRMVSPWNASISTPISAQKNTETGMIFDILMTNSSGSTYSEKVAAVGNRSTNVYIPYNVWLISISLKAYEGNDSSTIFSGLAIDISALRSDMTHNVTISESGIPSGRLWYVKYGNSTVYSRSDSISLSLHYPEETVSFGSSQFSPDDVRESVSWNESSVHVTFFRKRYDLGIEAGISSRAVKQSYFVLMLNGMELVSNNGTFNLELQGGNYSFSIIMITSGFVERRNISTDLESNTSMVVYFSMPEVSSGVFPSYILYISFAALVTAALAFYLRRNHYTVCTKCGSLLRGKRY